MTAGNLLWLRLWLAGLSRRSGAPADHGSTEVFPIFKSISASRKHSSRPLPRVVGQASCLSSSFAIFKETGPAGSLSHYHYFTPVCARRPGATLFRPRLAASRATRYRVFKQVAGVDATMVSAATVTESDHTFTGQPSGKTLKVQIIAANDAGQVQPSVTVEIVVP